MDSREGRDDGGLRPRRNHLCLYGARRGRIHRRAEEPCAVAGGVRAGVGGWRRGDGQPGELSGAGPDPRVRHRRADQPLQDAGGAVADGRWPQTVARRLRADRAAALRWRRHRNPERKAAHRRVEGRRGAPAAGGQARPLHHQHRLCQLCHSRSDLRRSAHQGQLRGGSGGGRRGNLRPWHGDQEAGAPALVHRRSDLQPEGAGQPYRGRIHGAGRRDRAELQPRRGDRGGLPPDARHGGVDDGGQAAVGGRAGDSLPEGALPRRGRSEARLHALRAWHPAARGRTAPAG